MASMVGNPSGTTSAERLTGGKEAPGGAGRAAGETVRQQAVARAARYVGGGPGKEGRRFGPAPGKRAGGGLVEKAQGYR